MIRMPITTTAGLIVLMSSMYGFCAEDGEPLRLSDENLKTVWERLWAPSKVTLDLNDVAIAEVCRQIADSTTNRFKLESSSLSASKVSVHVQDKDFWDVLLQLSAAGALTIKATGSEYKAGRISLDAKAKDRPGVTLGSTRITVRSITRSKWMRENANGKGSEPVPSGDDGLPGLEVHLMVWVEPRVCVSEGSIELTAAVDERGKALSYSFPKLRGGGMANGKRLLEASKGALINTGDVTLYLSTPPKDSRSLRTLQGQLVLHAAPTDLPTVTLHDLKKSQTVAVIANNQVEYLGQEQTAMEGNREMTLSFRVTSKMSPRSLDVIKDLSVSLLNEKKAISPVRMAIGKDKWQYSFRLSAEDVVRGATVQFIMRPTSKTFDFEFHDLPLPEPLVQAETTR